MSIEYTWTWGPMKIETINDLDDVVTGIYFVVIASDPAATGDRHGKTTGLFNVPPVDPVGFIPLSNITNDIVQNWITNHFDKTSYENEALDNYQEVLNIPVKLIELP